MKAKKKNLFAVRWMLGGALFFHTLAGAQGPGVVDPTLKQIEPPREELPSSEPEAPAPLPELDFIPGLRVPEAPRLSGAPIVFVKRFDITMKAKRRQCLKYEPRKNNELRRSQCSQGLSVK